MVYLRAVVIVAILVLLALFLVGTFPILLIPLLFGGLAFVFWISYSDKKEKAFRKAQYDLKWNVEAVFERRLSYAKLFEGSTWTRNVSLEVGAKKFIGNSYSGIIKTVTGLEIWRCDHAHEKHRTKSGRFSFQVNPSIEDARKCAQKELTKNYARYLALAKTKKGGNRHKRSKMENVSDESIYDTLKAFSFQCAYCGLSGLTKENTHRDHVVPLHVGGRNTSENMLPVCAECNLAKGTKSVFQFLLEIEARNSSLPFWVLNSSTWQEFRNQS